MAGRSIFLSKSHNPWFNLSFEDWLFRKSDPNTRILYIYRNSPCVVIGRNQNPWKEIDLHQLSKLNIPFVRRKSGGGTVYHDLGNTNYCVLTSRTTFDRDSNAKLVARVLRKSFGIEAYVNERHDVCLDGFKVSGSAYKLTTHRAYHHGSMLLHANLSSLRGLLSPVRERLVTKGVLSVPSKVTNLQSFNPTLNHDTFAHAVVSEFKNTYNVEEDITHIDENSFPDESKDYVQSVIKELQSWDWQYGQTPEFTHDFLTAGLILGLTSKHGLITSVHVSSEQENSDVERKEMLELQLKELLVGKRYGQREDVNVEGETAHIREIVEYLYNNS